MKKLLLVPVLTSLILISCGKLGGLIPQKASRNGVNIEYTGVSKEDANLLLAFLADRNTDGSVEDYKLSKEGDGYRIKMILPFGFGNTTSDIEEMTEFACDISISVYSKKDVTIDVCDNKFNVKNTMKSGGCDQFEMIGKEMKKYGEIELYYGKDITSKEREDVGKYVMDFFGDDRDIPLVIDKVNGKGVFSVIVDKKYYDDDEIINDYRILACDMGVFLGVESEVHLCDGYMKPQKVIKAEKCD